MESEKVKEIKKVIQETIDGKLSTEYLTVCEISCCPRLDIDKLFADILNLINELESENERLLGAIDIANEREYRKKFNDEWRKEYQKELDKQGKGRIAGFPDFDLVYKLYFEQKDRIAELENTDYYKEIERKKEDLLCKEYGLIKYEKEIAALKAENAALRERLEKAVCFKGMREF